MSAESDGEFPMDRGDPATWRLVMQLSGDAMIASRCKSCVSRKLN